MKNLYSNPARIYFLLAFLALCGIWAGSTLPVSLFPNVQQPGVAAGFSLKGLTGEEFRSKYGSSLESGLKALRRPGLRVVEVRADYSTTDVDYNVKFNWNADPDEAQKEVKSLIDASAATMPEEIRDSRWTWSVSGRNKGFFLATCRSNERTPAQIFELLDPILKPRAAALEDGTVNLFNPDKQQIVLQLKPERMASFGIFPQDVIETIKASLTEASGGTLKLGQSDYTVVIPKSASSVEAIESISIATPKRGVVRLTEIADVILRKNDSQIFKTSGVQSLLIVANLKDGGNIKRLSENLKEQIAEVSKLLPADIKFEILVDPSVSIQASIENVVHEVAIGAGLAVLILFLFIGSFRNVITAAIEIPLSLVLAFILMKAFGMNLNLISLGGLALSSGMNVDASVVVMENIFRKFEGVVPSALSINERVERVVQAVKEVLSPIVASTVASLVVFIPIVFTSDLTNAILGDLAKAVVFSHVFSAFVALLLVPTVRLHLMRIAGKKSDLHRPPIEFFLVKLEVIYVSVLAWFAHSKKAILVASAVVTCVLAGMAWFILPKLPTEIVGKPDSNLVGVWASGRGFTRIQQLESLLNDVEKSIAKELPGVCTFTYTEIHNANDGILLCNLQSRAIMKQNLERMEKLFKSTPEFTYEVFQWNVAELPLPNPFDVQVDFSGGTIAERAKPASELSGALRGRFKGLNVYSSTQITASNSIVMQPREDVWRNLNRTEFLQTPASILNALRQYNSGEFVGMLSRGRDSLGIKVTTPSLAFADAEDLKAFPVAVGDKILPLRSLFDISKKSAIDGAHYINGEESMSLNGRVELAQKKNSKQIVAEVKLFVEQWKQKAGKAAGIALSLGDPDKEVRSAINQLGVAAAWSILLIFITMLLQFGSLVEAILVLVAVPLALIGVLASLFVFGSTLSVNSVLGIILLNGIAVANSILLVDFAKRLHSGGMAPREAVVTAAKRRLRPILITSLTTILGMMPIAFGFGEGGKVLQPLGIAVSGGMWISMLLTIFFVPALHGLYLARISKRKKAVEVGF